MNFYKKVLFVLFFHHFITASHFLHHGSYITELINNTNHEISVEFTQQDPKLIRDWVTSGQRYVNYNFKDKSSINIPPRAIVYICDSRIPMGQGRNWLDALHVHIIPLIEYRKTDISTAGKTIGLRNNNNMFESLYLLSDRKSYKYTTLSPDQIIDRASYTLEIKLKRGIPTYIPKAERSNDVLINEEGFEFILTRNNNPGNCQFKFN